MQPEPKILYKYRSLSESNFKFTRNIFINNELYFSHPNQINDPFDCKTLPCLKNLTKENLLKYLEKINLKQKILKGCDSLEKIKKNIPNTPLPVLKKRIREGLKSYQNVGVLSLSETYLDILMWSHYADSHNGICIGFDYSKLSFIFKKTALVPDQVKYPKDNSYPEWSLFDYPEDLVDKIYFIKAKNWEYEREWRIIFPEHGKTLQKINPNALVSVYLGCQISEDIKDTVIKWCLQRKQKPKVYKMIEDNLSYSLKEQEVSY